MIYLDSSALIAKLLLEDRHTSDEFWDQDLISSRLLAYEVWNRVHARGLAGTHGDAAETLLTRVDLIDLSSAALALQPFPVAVRTLDGLHLATMVYLRRQMAELTLASYDKRMNECAEALGFRLYPL